MPILTQVLNDRRALKEEPFMAIVGDGVKNLAVFCDIKKTVDVDGRELVLEMEKSISLSVIDQEWKEHLRDMDDLKQSVQNASYEQKDPLLIYKFEAVELFQSFLKKVNAEAVSFLMKANVMEMRFQQVAPPKTEKPELSTNRNDEEGASPAKAPAKKLKVANRNQRVSVQYRDGTVKKDVKYKNVEADVANGNAVLVG
jgi:preprotein translocase subunit SecA